LFFVDAGIFYRGYNADLGACGSVGEPSAQALREFEAIRTGIAATLAIVREGVTGGALYATMVNTIRESGFPEFRTNFAGHTIGLEAREVPFTFAPEVPYDGPFLPPISEMPLPAGAVINVEAPIGRMGHGGYQFERSVVVTPDGYRPLVTQNQGSRVVG
jgi:Xaa-Pro aminopeptidase